MRKIIDRLLKDIINKISEKGASFTVTDVAKEIILDKGYDAKYGARPLKRAIQRELEDKLSKLSLTGCITEGKNIIADAKNGEIVVYVN